MQASTSLISLNLKKLPEFNQFVADYRPLKICYCVRYLNRPLLASLTDLLLPGEHFAISHFVVNEDGRFPYDHPRMAEVLQLNEMKTYFPNTHWTVLHNKTVKDSDAGRSLLNFCVRRIGAEAEIE